VLLTVSNVSVQSKSRNPYSMDWYMLGTSATFLGNHTAANFSSGGEDVGFFQSTLQNSPQ
jgi:hypothetical protein